MKVSVGIGAVACIALAALVLRPVPILSEGECAVVVGEVVEISEGTSSDIVFRLEGVEGRFYINRGLEQGLDLETLRRDLLGEEVTFKYPEHWSPLDPGNRSRHLSKVEHGATVIFDETVKSSEGR